MNLLWEISFVELIFITGLLGGGAAWMTGRAVAITWKDWWQLVVYVVLLCLAVRFIHFSLFQGSFFLPPSTFGTALYYYVVDFIILGMAAIMGRQSTRARQMSTQYGFLYSRSGPFNWRRNS